MCIYIYIYAGAICTYAYVYVCTEKWDMRIYSQIHLAFSEIFPSKFLKQAKLKNFNFLPSLYV